MLWSFDQWFWLLFQCRTRPKCLTGQQVISSSWKVLEADNRWKNACFGFQLQYYIMKKAASSVTYVIFHIRHLLMHILLCARKIKFLYFKNPWKYLGFFSIFNDCVPVTVLTVAHLLNGIRRWKDTIVDVISFQVENEIKENWLILPNIHCFTINWNSSRRQILTNFHILFSLETLIPLYLIAIHWLPW